MTRALEAGKTLGALDDELRDVLRRCGSEPRRLTTNAPGLGYFAERYDCIVTDQGGAETVSVYVDSLGAPGSGAETYEDMMRINADRIAHAGQNVLVERVHQNA